LSRVITNTATIKTIEDSILLATLLICIFGIFQFVGDSVGLSQSVTGLRIQYTKIVMDFPRVQSVALEPLYFANFLFIPLFISVKRYLLSGKAFGKYFWLTFLITLSITLTVSRGAFLALAITFLFLLIYLLYTKNGGLLQRYTKLLISVAASIIVALILIFVFDGKQALQIFFGHSVVTNIQADASSYNRISAYKQSIDVFKLHPVLGNGVASFGIVTTPQADIAKTGYATVNNEYLEILAETGILGFLLFVLFIIFYFKEIYSRSKFKKESTKTGLFIGCLAVVAILIQYNFFSTFYIIYIWAFLALIKSNSLAESNL
jgi:O-antigen ligase